MPTTNANKMALQKLEEELKTEIIGKNITYFETIDSTQSEIWRRIQNKSIENGDLVLAEIQTQGKRNTWKNMAHRRKKQYCIFIFYKSKL